jgi:hypothetical protein
VRSSVFWFASVPMALPSAEPENYPTQRQRGDVWSLQGSRCHPEDLVGEVREA